MLEGERTVTIPAAAADVWAVIGDLAGYPAWHPFFAAVEVVVRDPQGRVSQARCEHPTPAGALRTELRLAYEEHTSLEVTRSAGDMKAMAASFLLHPVGDGTAVTHRIRVDPGMRLGLLLRGPVEERVRERILTGALDGLAAHLRARG
ncbi:unannotated protein [freshwater metagenome]|uniref:Unannotated protein n=1 Tax=freshwater metagenome TaxID=449393 RepID=A0A6J7D7P5_9ZZZZ|nr:hypothetical protein [Actinomycetota bacterium]